MHGLLIRGLLHGLRRLHGLHRLLVSGLLDRRVVSRLHGLIELLGSLGLCRDRGGLPVKEGRRSDGHHNSRVANHVVALLYNFDTCEENSTRITTVSNFYDDFTVFEEMIRIMVLFVIVPLSIS